MAKKGRDVAKAEFAQRLGRLMAAKQFSQSDLARAASKQLGEEFRRDNIHCYLNEIAIPRPRQLNAIAAALDVSPHELLPGVKHSKQPLPMSFRVLPDDPAYAMLYVDMKVPTQTALAVLALLGNAK